MKSIHGNLHIGRRSGWGAGVFRHFVDWVSDVAPGGMAMHASSPARPPVAKLKLLSKALNLSLSHPSTATAWPIHHV